MNYWTPVPPAARIGFDFPAASPKMGMSRLSIIPCLFVAVMHGCGLDPNGFRPPMLHLAGDCTVVVLDWTGGDSPLWADGALPPIDLAEFPLAWPRCGETLADMDGFREMVRAEIEDVLTASGLRVTVEEGEQRAMASVVHFSPVIDPDSDVSLGRGQIDMCNLSDHDYSIVYATRFLEECRLDEGEWVRVFANVAAHEIAHNFGFDHVDPDDVPESEFVELMLAGQTILQRVRRQRIIVEQDTCAIFGAAKATRSDLGGKK